LRRPVRLAGYKFFTFLVKKITFAAGEKSGVTNKKLSILARGRR
jgi:hypothetical protein